MENNKFKTKDISLASYLHSHDIQLITIVPLDSFNSEFVFERPPQRLLDAWLGGKLPEKTAIDSYRHLLRDARIAQKASFGKAGFND